ncbi:monoacylglycerol lipase ABHD6-like [Biomphalaria glabrata]|uniref:acylglycerol lipase n=1 Tax=Biomphalaria glabrata TaxID=6526 RepID=A0A9W3A694_BIOGL|nr:monoacylglycerol lipase ABHD6-like [Biomphalaria glabrata]XP_055882680.1 monoacylglycerol lipase ABHD6-like [Biomphalaria glabrata]XP_055882681.1 monoacylglycerol lipase ABHD6-like [Biomphalaria glabrata]KAI8735662.1 monoacylglycerol lipase ABHD6-like [Biomphalaria glabrata]
MEMLLSLVDLELTLLNPATFTVATITTLMTLYVYFIQPSMLLKAYFRVAVRWSGMRMNYTKPLPDGFQFFYGEKGYRKKGQMSILMLHGFSADHFMWAPVVRNIPSDIHVIVLDLPGHGFTSNPINEDDIEFKGQVRRIRQFLDLVDLSSQPLHVVGVSMGALVAGIFASECSQMVSALTLTCPWMKTPFESRIIRENKKVVLEKYGGLLTLENCPMLPQTAEGLQNMLDISHFHSVKYPQQILKGAVELRKQKNDIYLHLVNILISEETSLILENLLNKIKCPSQVIWGRDDWVVDVSGVDILQEKLANCQHIDILEECGHAVNLDQPNLFATKVLTFWKSLNNSL